ncbi:hypothetical protein D9757_012856 [Collybiopsis confluens]|uniref:Uncharacterized protein n=1 Tax=Collybiopsis confluens TaxID=2823264 RepID=A0A8H5G1N1_9AGAR|nr:hypothetical protein D9757_012856 [Collybiopsis confluens]
MASDNRNCSTLPPPPEIITYRLGDKLIYVKPVTDYGQAIDLAIQEFPILRAYTENGDGRDRIAFYTVTEGRGTKHSVCISKSAWEPCVSRMLRGDVVNIVVTPSSSSSSSTSSSSPSSSSVSFKANETDFPPPSYLEVPLPDQSGRSPTSHRRSRSTGTVVGPSSSSSSAGRPRSPSGSTKSTESRRRSWFRK